ncbi:MAG: peptidoglycan DD-metalloendopeptidase family protein [Pseudomonadota bacterium]
MRELFPPTGYGRPGRSRRYRKLVVIVPIIIAGLAAAGYGNLFQGITGLLSPPRVANSAEKSPAADGENAAEGFEAEPQVQDENDESTVEVTDVTEQGDTLFAILNANLAESSQADKVAQSLASIINAHTQKNRTKDVALRPGVRYSIMVNRRGDFVKASLELDPASVFHCALEAEGLRAWKEDVVLEFRDELLTFKVNGNMVQSILNAGEGADLAHKVTNVFRWDIDFQAESQKGDVCKVLFRRRYADDRPSGYGEVLAAVYEGRKTGRKAGFLFSGTYYDDAGTELKKDFLRSPLNTIRVTSKYGNRLHPILKVWRKHDGVDYAAPTGTPVFTVSRGVVSFAGWKNGYGNYVCIVHPSGHESRYGHLSGILVKKGQRVEQRQRIGLVGMTGRATGPHLDFQLLVKGKHVDPLKVKMVATLAKVPTPLRDRFDSIVKERTGSLVNHAGAGKTGRNRLAKLP